MIRSTALVLVLLAAAPGSARQQEPPVVHGAACPDACATCSAAISRALDFLASRQVKDGCIPAHDPGLQYVRTDRNVTHVFTTALAGLAFMASGSTPSSGPYQRELRLARRFLQERVDEIQRASPRISGGGGGPIYASALCLQFFVHVHEKEKDPESRRTCESLVAFLVAAVGDKVGTSVWKNGRDEGTLWYISGVTALLNSTLLALGRAESIGLEVPGRVWKLGQEYYAKYFEAEGSVKYDQHNMFPEEPRYGRTIVSLLVLRTMKADGAAGYKAAYRYAREHADKAWSHHTPSLHLTLSAHAFHDFGPEDWAKFVGLYHAKLLARQKPDGSLEKIWDHDPKVMMTPNDTMWGATYATAHFALVLQVPRTHVRFRAKRKA